MKKLLSMLCVCSLLFIVAFSPITAFAKEDSGNEPVLENLGIPLQMLVPDGNSNVFGRSIWNMEEFNGRIYIGCGDFSNNLGAKLGGLPMFSFVTETNKWQEEKKIDDEQISRFFKVDDAMYMNGMDPISGNHGNIYRVNADGVWDTIRSNPTGVHVFDLLFSNNITYAAYGQSYGDTPTICYSKDNQLFEPIEFKYNGQDIILQGLEFPRSYNLIEFKGEIYASLSISNASTNKYNGLYKLDKEKMVLNYIGVAPQGILSYGINPVNDTIFNGMLIIPNDELTYTDDIEGVTDDPNTKEYENIKKLGGYKGTVKSAKVINDELYFVSNERKENEYTSYLYKTKDLSNVELVYSFDYDSFVNSFCYYDGLFYLGTAGSRELLEETTGTVFSLDLSGSANNQKTDLTVQVNLKKDGDKFLPKYLKVALKAGNKIVGTANLKYSSNWDYTFKNIDNRTDWSVEVIDDLSGCEWEYKKKLNKIIISNITTASANIWVYIIGAISILAVGAAVILFIIKKKKKN